MSSGNKTVGIFKTNIIETPLLSLFLLIPFIVTYLLGLALCGTSDSNAILTWTFTLFIFALAVLPLGFYIFKNLGSGGFIVTQTLGLIVVSLFVWEFTYIGVYSFNYLLTVVAIIIVAAICYGIKPLRDNFIEKLKEPLLIPQIAIEETVFAVCLVLLCFYKGFSPAINGQEKFMDYGFIMSMLRNSKLPANDMWLSGLKINYYYFGQFIWALVIKLSGIYPGVGYNLAMCSAIAIPFAMSFSIGCQLMEVSNKFGNSAHPAFKYVTGLLTGFAVTIFGNSHSFFYDEKSFGNNILQWFKSMGVEVGRTDSFFYPDSTRFIGWNPETKVNGGDCTIEEFPFYSFLVGDLHAHVISMMVVLLILSICIVLISKVQTPMGIERSVEPSLDNLNKKSLATDFKKIISVETVTIAVLLGVAQMTNYWDFLIYFIFISMTMFIYFTVTSKTFADVRGTPLFVLNVAGILGLYLRFSENVILHIVLQMVLLLTSYIICIYAPSALTRTGLGMSFMFTVAYIIAAPFNYNFDMISNSLGKCINHSPLFQLWILWGTHIFAGVVFIVVTILYKNYSKPGKRDRNKKNYQSDIMNIPSEGFTNPVQKFFCERNIVDIFVCGMLVVAVILLIAPEIFYVRDIYTSGYLRANTMFKFAFAAFIILSVCLSYITLRLFWVINKRGNYSNVGYVFGIICVILLLVPSHYTILSLEQRCGELKKENYKTLDGTVYLADHYSEDSYVSDYGNLKSYDEAIRWFNKNVSGNPVICEAYGESYHDNNIVSAYTGLQTVIGWQTHEWLWRFHGIVNPETDLIESDPERDVWKIYLWPRYADVDIIYKSSNLDEIQAVINKYQIEYIVIGNLEYYKYDLDNSYNLNQLGETVFTYDNLNIIKVNPQ